MTIKLNKSQQKKYNSICYYLMTEIGKNDGLFLDDNKSVNMRWITKIYINATGIYIDGFNFCGTVKFTDRLNREADITNIFRAGIRSDYDFKQFVEMEEFND